MKARIHAAQHRATLAVNRELLTLYWRIGRDIPERQVAGTWGMESSTKHHPTSGLPFPR